MELWAFISHSFYQLKKCSRTVHIETRQKHEEKAVFYPKKTRRNSGHKETGSDFLLYTSCHNLPPQYKDDTVEQRPTAQGVPRATHFVLPGLSTTSTPKEKPNNSNANQHGALRRRQEVIALYWLHKRWSQYRWFLLPPEKSSQKSKTMSYVQVILKHKVLESMSIFTIRNPRRSFSPFLPGCKPFQESLESHNKRRRN